MTQENSASLLRRFFIYQKERFPFLGHGLLIGAFTFSAISYSRICGGAEGFVSLKTYGIGVFITLTLFFLVRIFDEFKDKDDDAKYRQYLPVPRGLISLKELSIIGGIVVALQVAVLSLFQMQMFLLYAIVIGYLLLMRVEFFVPEWLKKRQMLYITSHMFIIPLIDVYASGLDWLLGGNKAPFGLIFFFAVSYMNGIVLEFGRKIKTPDTEEEGVLSYTKYFGTRKAVWVWLLTLLVTLGLSIAASLYAGYGMIGYAILTGFFILCGFPGALFLNKPTVKRAKMIEHASALWTISMYLTLGGVPMLTKLIAG